MKLNKFILTIGLSLTITTIPIYAGYSDNSQEPQKDTTSSFEALKRKSKQNFNRTQNDSIFKAKVNKFSSQNENETYEDFRRKTKEEYDTFKKETIKEYLQYRDSVLGDFVKVMSQPWKLAESKAAEEKPKDESVEPERVSEEEFLQMMKNLYQEDSTDTKSKKDSINQCVNTTVYNDTVPTESLAEFTSNVSNKFLSFIKRLFKDNEQATINEKTKVQPKKEAKLTTTKKQANADSKTTVKAQPKATVKEVSKAKVEPKKEAKPVAKKQETATVKEEPKETAKETVKTTVKVTAKETVKDTVKKDAPKSVILSGGEPQQISIKKVVSLADLNIAIQPTPFVPVITHDDSTPQEFEFTFYGTPLKVRIDDRCKFKINKPTNKGFTEAYEKIIKNKYLSTTLKDCLKLREDYYLCDWSYLQMLDKLCTDFFGGKCNEATLLTGHLYCMSGYQMRYAYNSNNELFILFTCDQVLCGMKQYFLPDEGYRTYFPFNYTPKDNERIHTCNFTIPKEKSMSLYIKETPAFDKDIKNYDHVSYKFKAGINYSVNKNLVDFYNTYPIPMTKDDPYTRWSYYALTPLSDEAKATFYPAIKKHINGMRDVEAVNMILDLIQTYKYEYDNVVWGHDRAFFPDETLFYPSCDCEDRAILFARTVNDLLGLETALIYYPGHLAAAVRFKEDVKNGHYILKDGIKYTVCDPTIQYAPEAGFTKDKYKRPGIATLLLLNHQK